MQIIYIKIGFINLDVSKGGLFQMGLSKIWSFTAVEKNKKSTKIKVKRMDCILDSFKQLIHAMMQLRVALSQFWIKNLWMQT